MENQSSKGRDLNKGLEDVSSLPGFDKGHPHYFSDPMVDHLLEICLQLAGEIWVNRDRQLVIEHLLAKEGKVTPEMIEAFRPDPEMKESMKRSRQQFTRRVFNSLYAELDDGGQADFLKGIIR